MMGLFSQAGYHFRTAAAPKPRGSLEYDRTPSDAESDDTSLLSVSFSFQCSHSMLTRTIETTMRALS